MDRGREGVVKGDRETFYGRIVILLRGPLKPILRSRPAAELHLTQIHFALFLNCPALMH